MAGRKIGYLQATLMVIGFVLTMLYLLAVIGGLIMLLTDARMSEGQLDAGRHRYAVAGMVGLGLCIVAWCWSLMSSIAIVRQSQKEPPILPHRNSIH
jgi:hypothetical protein